MRATPQSHTLTLLHSNHTSFSNDVWKAPIFSRYPNLSMFEQGLSFPPSLSLAIGAKLFRRELGGSDSFVRSVQVLLPLEFCHEIIFDNGYQSLTVGQHVNTKLENFFGHRCRPSWSPHHNRRHATSSSSSSQLVICRHRTRTSQSNERFIM